MAQKTKKATETFSTNFVQVEIPRLIEVPSRKNYYQTNLKDDFYEQLIHLYENANVHSSFINNLKERIVGSNMIAATPESQLIINKYKLDDLFTRITFDYVLYGGFAIEVIWNVLHTQITQLNYLDFSRVRSGYIDEETDKVEFYHYSPDWHAYKKEITLYQTFNPAENFDNRQIYYYKDIYPGKDIYPRPDYMAGLKWVYTEVELCRYYANLVKNNFVPTTLLTVNSFFDEEKQMAFEKSLKQFTGGDAAGTIFVIYNEGGDDTTKPELLKFNADQEDQKYTWLSTHTIEELIIAHRIPNPLLAGVKTSGQLGGATELQISERQYQVQVVMPKRQKILNVINELNKWVPGDLQYDVKNVNIFNDENN
jgi:hypothetical protein